MHDVHFFLDKSAHSAHIRRNKCERLAILDNRREALSACFAEPGKVMDMLTDIFVARGMLGYDRINLHQHATISCKFRNRLHQLKARVAALFG